MRHQMARVLEEGIEGSWVPLSRVVAVDRAARVAAEDFEGWREEAVTRWAQRMFRRAVECGMIRVKVSVPAPVAYFPFTDWKDSFFGDLHATGRDGADLHAEKKVVIEW